MSTRAQQLIADLRRAGAITTGGTDPAWLECAQKHLDGVRQEASDIARGFNRWRVQRDLAREGEAMSEHLDDGRMRGDTWSEPPRVQQGVPPMPEIQTAPETPTGPGHLWHDEDGFTAECPLCENVQHMHYTPGVTARSYGWAQRGGRWVCDTCVVAWDAGAEAMRERAAGVADAERDAARQAHDTPAWCAASRIGTDIRTLPLEDAAEKGGV